jgi:hypothetical protein
MTGQIWAVRILHGVQELYSFSQRPVQQQWVPPLSPAGCLEPTPRTLFVGSVLNCQDFEVGKRFRSGTRRE